MAQKSGKASKASAGTPKGSLRVQVKASEEKSQKRKRDESESDDDSESIDVSTNEESDNESESDHKDGSSESESEDERSDDSGNEGDEGSDSETDGSSNESEYSDDDNDEIPALPAKKKNKSDGSEAFSKAMNALLDSKLKAHDRKDPILARSKTQLKKLESEKLELKAKRQLLAEKKAKLTSNRVRNLLPTDDSLAREVLEKEKKYRKVAQRGVIKLFNAILSTQTETNKEVGALEGVGQSKKKELINEISTEKFLDLVQEAGKN
ncbi:hypothetical protein OGAPHI_003425 [Ogataea philodendri]|uniref:Rrp15p-domain-containing protein n=2 Tax=Saccharomycotina TaxID=147537 RepID=A0A9P8P850_9ASCO|nr:uncharacterized protein OGAPHI_003425 [Ogataea philodendri]KAH3666975.1 hypothetical protein OGAPHI_003425 [Ogataea philodendri]